MTLRYEEEKEPGFSFPPKELAEKVLLRGLEAEGIPEHAEISLTLTGDEEIRELNREYREIDSATDVLSFPLLEEVSPGDYKEALRSPENRNPDTGDLMLGDIVISVDHVHSQAEEYGHSREREFAFLLIHSLLHLLGYDHMTPEDEKRMFSRQEEILTGLSITRD